MDVEKTVMGNTRREVFRRNQGRGKYVRATLGSLLVSLSAGCFGAAGDSGLEGDEAGRCVVPPDAARMADQALQLVNLERTEAGLPPLVADSTLEQLAADYACAMIENDFFGHVDAQTGAGPGERAARRRYAFYAVGENLAAGQESAAEVMDLWMESPAHREVILDPRWVQIGVAVRGGGRHGVYWVQEFGDPARFPASPP